MERKATKYQLADAILSILHSLKNKHKQFDFILSYIL